MSTGVLVLRVLVVIAVAVGAFFLVFALANAPSGEPRRLGLRGLKRQRALADPTWARIEPLVRWIGRRLRGWISESQEQRLDLQITRAGDYLGLVPEEVVGLSAVGAISGLTFAILVKQVMGGGDFILLAGAGFGGFAAFLALGSRTTERMKSVSRRLPHAIDLLALAMGAGLDFPSSVQQLVDKAGNQSEPLIEELTLLLQSLQIGRTRRQVLEELAHRVPCRSVIDFVSAIVQAELRGTPVVHVLQVQADCARQQRSGLAEEAAARAAVKLIVPLALIFLCVLLVIAGPMVLRLQSATT
jgi:tight adherence protein C